MENIATMTAAQLEKHVSEIDYKHKRRMTALRALIRARQAEEDSYTVLGKDKAPEK